MHVIFVGVHGLELDVRDVVLDVCNPSHDEGLNAFIDDLASVFGRKHKVVVAEKYAV